MHRKGKRIEALTEHDRRHRGIRTPQRDQALHHLLFNVALLITHTLAPMIHANFSNRTKQHRHQQHSGHADTQVHDHQIFFPFVGRALRQDRVPPMQPEPGQTYFGLGQVLTASSNGTHWFYDETEACLKLLQPTSTLPGNRAQLLSDYASPNGLSARFANFAEINAAYNGELSLVIGIDADLQTLFAGGYDQKLQDVGSYLAAHPELRVFARPFYELSAGGAYWPIIYAFAQEHPELGTAEEIAVAAYQRVVDQVDTGAGSRLPNLAWVWHIFPRSDSWATTHWLKLYPGPEYVDYVGLSVFNWAQVGALDTTANFIEESIGKPIMLPEMGMGIGTEGVFDEQAIEFAQALFDFFASHPSVVSFNLICNHMDAMMGDDNWPNMWLPDNPALAEQIRELVAQSKYQTGPIVVDQP